MQIKDIKELRDQIYDLMIDGNIETEVNHNFRAGYERGMSIAIELLDEFIRREEC